MPVNTRKTRAKTKGTAFRPSQEFSDAPLIVGELPDELTDWRMAVEQDDEYQAIRRAVGNRDRKMPSEYGLKVSITECTLSLQGDLLFRGRRWVPSTDNLRTRIIQQTHDSVIEGHLRREATYAFIIRQFF